MIEKADKVGGLARTEDYKGFQFDMGGHRFFTKVEEVNKIWREILGDQFLRRPRLSRIYYKRKFFDYPLKPLNALVGLGLLAEHSDHAQLYPLAAPSLSAGGYLRAMGDQPVRPALFQTFFKTYTEKVWGIPCSELKAEWAAQRIKDLSLKTAVLSMFVKPKHDHQNADR